MLAQPSGQILAGSTSLIMTGLGAMSATGGWAVIGNGTQVIRYTGVSTSALTGIPASGVGSIVAPISYNSQATAAPALIGVTGILYAIKKGDPVNLLVVVDDVAAQTALATFIGGDGVQEIPLQDGTLGDVECVSRGEAQLALTRDVLVTLTGKSYDMNMRSGSTLTVNLGSPFNIPSIDFLIQQVLISNTEMKPIFEFTATSLRFTFDDLLRSFQKVT